VTWSSATVEQHLTGQLGPGSARASVTFVGAEPVEVLRFGPDRDGLVRYVTVGMSRHPMSDPADPAPDQVRGPRAELVLSVRAIVDSVRRRLAALAMTPFVEGIVVGPAAGLDLAEPLWDGAPFTACLVGDPGGLVLDLPIAPPADPVRFLPVLPMTPAEAAWKRARGAEALRKLWLHHGTDLRDPARRTVPLELPAPDASEDQ
jgi:hypothetical protein